jgi:glutamyl-tRNA synthetase
VKELFERGTSSWLALTSALNEPVHLPTLCQETQLERDHFMNSPTQPKSTTILSEADRNELANVLFPDHASLPTLSQLEERYPARQLPEGAMVLRVAPSPTGFAHIGVMYMALVNRRLATQTGGVFILRVEDTDSKREVKGAMQTIIDCLDIYGLNPDEGYVRKPDGSVEQRGAYGPYLQSERSAVYRSCAMHLVRTGFAYPCFCTEQEIEQMASDQTAQKTRTGYYGYWARWRDRTVTEVKAELAKGLPFVIRLRSWKDEIGRVAWSDGVKGKTSLPCNDLDSVILKSDGHSLYHLAHAMDDRFMRVTHVMRGDEWFPSVPLHIQIFQAFGWQHPHYSHLSTIQKTEIVTEKDPETGIETQRTSKRKLAKRKDPEANALYYLEQGFPPQSVIEYLTNIVNSDFEDWRKANPNAPLLEFPVKVAKLSPSGSMADPVKLTSVSKDVISRMPVEELYREGVRYAERYDPQIADLMKADPDYARAALNIERDGKKASKRIATWKDLRPQLGWFYDQIHSEIKEFPFPEGISVETRSRIIQAFLATYDPADDRDQWFAKCKVAATQIGFAAEMKEFKANPGKYPGHVGDLTTVLRVALSGGRESPDLCEVMRVLGVDRVRARLKRVTVLGG